MSTEPSLAFARFAAAATASAIVAGCVAAGAEQTPAPTGPPTPVVVELFTSEGCSSCPPADDLLGALVGTQPVAGAEVVALEEHVDYWDELGWKDPFSSAALTDRQRRYAAAFHSDDIYTPQMVVDGRAGFVGSDASAARRAIGKARRDEHGALAIAVTAAGDGRATVSLTAGPLPASAHGAADLLLAVTEDHLQSAVTRGENHGRTLRHAALVRSLSTVGQVPAAGATMRGDVVLAPGWNRAALKVVAFVQERGSRRVLAAAVVPLETAAR